MLWQKAEDVKLNDTVCVFRKSEGKINQKQAKQEGTPPRRVCRKKSHTLDPPHHRRPSDSCLFCWSLEQISVKKEFAKKDFGFVCGWSEKVLCDWINKKEKKEKENWRRPKEAEKVRKEFSRKAKQQTNFHQGNRKGMGGVGSKVSVKGENYLLPALLPLTE